MSDSPGSHPVSTRFPPDTHPVSPTAPKVYTRFRCSCSRGFTRIYMVSGKPACAKCMSTKLLAVPCGGRS